jgi:hypothetical protein
MTEISISTIDMFNLAIKKFDIEFKSTLNHHKFMQKNEHEDYTDIISIIEKDNGCLSKNTIIVKVGDFSSYCNSLSFSENATIYSFKNHKYFN